MIVIYVVICMLIVGSMRVREWWFGRWWERLLMIGLRIMFVMIYIEMMFVVWVVLSFLLVVRNGMFYSKMNMVFVNGVVKCDQNVSWVLGCVQVVWMLMLVLIVDVMMCIILVFVLIDMLGLFLVGLLWMMSYMRIVKSRLRLVMLLNVIDQVVVCSRVVMGIRVIS